VAGSFEHDFHKSSGISSLVERLFSSQEGIAPMELATSIFHQFLCSDFTADSTLP
jgi:hypothetical protein